MVGRKFNIVADKLANNSHVISESNVIYDSVPGFIANLLYVDGYGPAGPLIMD